MYNLKTIQDKINNRFPEERLGVLTFTKVKEKFVLKCLNCETIYEFCNADNVINGNKKNVCSQCNPCLRKETLEVKNKLEYLKKNLTKIKIIKDFVNITTDLELLCLQCNEIFKRKPQLFLKTQKCPFCETKSKTKPNTLFQKELKDKFAEEYECLDEYINAYTKIKIRHKCGFIWKITPHNLLCGKGCPKCNRFTSKGEKKIEKFLLNNNISFVKEKTFIDLPLLRFDFYLPNKNLVIEFQGLQHYKSIDYFGGEQHFIKQKANDLKKKEYCKKQNIDFLEISYQEIDDIDFILANKLNDYPVKEYTQVSGKESQPLG